MRGRRTAPRPASVQAHLLDLADVHDDVLVLRDGATRAVLEVGGANLPLMAEREQEEASSSSYCRRYAGEAVCADMAPMEQRPRCVRRDA